MPMSDSDANPHAAGEKQLSLVKNDQRWLFRYRPGEEAQLLETLAEAAKDPAVNFDWFDAAVLCHQMGHRLQARLEQLKQQ